jgi:hypothetical protein
MAVALSRFDGPVQLVLSEHDYTAKEFSERAATDEAWRHLLNQHNVESFEVEDADHTFSSAAAAGRLGRACTSWLARCDAPRARAAAGAGL